MIHVNSATVYIYFNLFERGEATTSTDTYTIRFTNQSNKVNYDLSAQANKATERYFQFLIGDALDSAPDGFYDITVLNGATTLLTELGYLQKSNAVDYTQHTITTTYAINEQ
jgi:hypothetical protein